jgi:hypothetical protein
VTRRFTIDVAPPHPHQSLQAKTSRSARQPLSCRLC